MELSVAEWSMVDDGLMDLCNCLGCTLHEGTAVIADIYSIKTYEKSCFTKCCCDLGDVISYPAGRTIKIMTLKNVMIK